MGSSGGQPSIYGQCSPVNTSDHSAAKKTIYDQIFMSVILLWHMAGRAGKKASSVEPTVTAIADSVEPTVTAITDSVEPTMTAIADSVEPTVTAITDSVEPTVTAIADSVGANSDCYR